MFSIKSQNISKIKTRISKDEYSFKKAKVQYQKALGKVGHKKELEVQC